MTRTAIVTDQAPAPVPVFSQGVRKNQILQVSGQVSADPATGEFVHPGDVARQTEQTLRNVEAILTAAGATFDDVVMLRVFLTDRANFATMNDAYGAFVGARITSGVLPARTTAIVGLPAEALLVEIDALAVLD